GFPMYAYRWESKAVKGATQKIKVDYSLLLPVVNGRAYFQYVLRSGAAWGAPIKQETVTVKGEGVTLQGGSRTLKVEKPADGSLVWKLTNALPTEDIGVSIIAGPIVPNNSLKQGVQPR
ncbi:MAG: hypothetical protein PHU85_05915, partial [Phycisphaerae bacterium]|nr:hypothetical protein [Phycisphaerae bacterium]